MNKKKPFLNIYIFFVVFTLLPLFSVNLIAFFNKNFIENYKIERDFDFTYDSLNIEEDVDSLGDEIALEGTNQYHLGTNEDGDLYSWGEELYGELGDGGDQTSTLSEDNAYLLYDHEEGWTPQETKDTFNYENEPRLDGGIKQVSVGNHHNAVLMNNGTLWGWGSNLNIRLGLGGDGVNGSWNDIYTTPIIIYDGVEPDDDEFVEDFDIFKDWYFQSSSSNSASTEVLDSYLAINYYGLTEGSDIKAEAENDNPLYKNRPIGFWEISNQYFADTSATEHDNGITEQDTNIVNHRNAIQGDILSVNCAIDSTTIFFEDGSIFISDWTRKSYTTSGANEGYHSSFEDVNLNINAFEIDEDSIEDNFDDPDYYPSFNFSIYGSYGLFKDVNSDLTLSLSKAETPEEEIILDTEFLYLNEDGSKYYQTTTVEEGSEDLKSNQSYIINYLTLNTWEDRSDDPDAQSNFTSWIYEINQSNSMIHTDLEIASINEQNSYQIVNFDEESAVLDLRINFNNLNDTETNEVLFSFDVNGEEIFYYSEFISNEENWYEYYIYGFGRDSEYSDLSIYALDRESQPFLLYEDNDFYYFFPAQQVVRRIAIIIVVLIILIMIFFLFALYMYLKLRRSRNMQENKSKLGRGDI